MRLHKCSNGTGRIITRLRQFDSDAGHKRARQFTTAPGHIRFTAPTKCAASALALISAATSAGASSPVFFHFLSEPDRAIAHFARDIIHHIHTTKDRQARHGSTVCNSNRRKLAAPRKRYDARRGR